LYSKNKIDKSGRALSKNNFKSEDDEIESEIIFDDYRKSHLQPLTETTYLLQTWLSGFEGQYYIAQRLKRKPQILRKLRRFSVRLSQLQDIGGNRIIVDTNEDVERLYRFITGKLSKEKQISISRVTDYRPEGRDDTGYRALHIILFVNNRKIELQIRSRAQHYWSESIERTSVIYGHHLKENVGDERILQYFKLLSHIFYEIECRREPAPQEKMKLDEQRKIAEEIIAKEGRGAPLDSYINEGVIQSMLSVQQNKSGQINNWLLVFDWNTGNFVNWASISRDPQKAYNAYVASENQYSETEGYEVVLVGSSDVTMIRRTHSHYFGIDGYDGILENLDTSILGFSTRKRLDAGSRRVLHTLHRKNFWGGRTVSIETLKNHYCKNIYGIEESLKNLLELGLINMPNKKGPVSLNGSMREEIKSYL